MYSPAYLLTFLLCVSMGCMVYGFAKLTTVDKTVPVSEMSDEQRRLLRKYRMLALLPITITVLLMCLILL